jgi:hypothetical protein
LLLKPSVGCPLNAVLSRPLPARPHSLGLQHAFASHFRSSSTHDTRSLARSRSFVCTRLCSPSTTTLDISPVSRRAALSAHLLALSGHTKHDGANAAKRRRHLPAPSIPVRLRTGTAARRRLPTRAHSDEKTHAYAYASRSSHTPPYSSERKRPSFAAPPVHAPVHGQKRPPSMPLVAFCICRSVSLCVYVTLCCRESKFISTQPGRRGGDGVTISTRHHSI